MPEADEQQRKRNEIPPRSQAKLEKALGTAASLEKQGMKLSA